jgi:hypothetical protein
MRYSEFSSQSPSHVTRPSPPQHSTTRPTHHSTALLDPAHHSTAQSDPAHQSTALPDQDHSNSAHHSVHTVPTTTLRSGKTLLRTVHHMMQSTPCIIHIINPYMLRVWSSASHTVSTPHCLCTTLPPHHPPQLLPHPTSQASFGCPPYSHPQESPISHPRPCIQHLEGVCRMLNLLCSHVVGQGPWQSLSSLNK